MADDLTFHYRLPITRVGVTGIRRTTTMPGSTPTHETIGAVMELRVVGDEPQYDVIIPRDFFHKVEMDIALSPDGRLTSATHQSDSSATKLIGAVAKLGVSAVALGGGLVRTPELGLLEGVDGSSDDGSGDERDEAPRETAEAAATRKQREEDAAMLKTVTVALEGLLRQQVTAATAAVDTTSGKDLKAALGALRQLAELRSRLEAQRDTLVTILAAQQAQLRTTVDEPFDIELDLFELPTDIDFESSEHDDPQSETSGRHTPRWQSVWRATGIMACVSPDDSVLPSTSVGGEARRNAPADTLDAAVIHYLEPTRITLSIRVGEVGHARLQSVARHMVVGRHCNVRQVALNGSAFGSSKVAVAFNDLGGLQSLTTSRAGGADGLGDALGALQDGAASGLRYANTTRDDLRTRRGEGAADQLAALTAHAAMLQERIASAGLAAGSKDIEEMAALQHRLDRATLLGKVADAEASAQRDT